MGTGAASVPQRAARPVDAIDVASAGALVVLAAASWGWMTLAWTGAFTQPFPALCAGAAAVAGACTWLVSRPASRRPTSRLDATSLCAVALVAFVVCLHPARYVFDAADGSVYVAVAGLLRATGTTTPADPLVASLDDETRASFFPPGEDDGTSERFPGGIAVDRTNVVRPGFFHLFPAWLAAAEVLAGIGWFVNPLFGVGSILTIWLLARRTSGLLAATLAAALLASNVAQIWYVRFPSSEAIAQFFVLATLYLALVAIDAAWPAALIGSAACLGAAAFARLDVLLLVVPAAAIATGAAASYERLRLPLAAAAALLLALVAQAILYARAATGPYAGRVVDVLVRYAERRPSNVLLLAAAMAGAAVAARQLAARGSVPRALAVPLSGLAAMALAYFLWKDFEHGAFLQLVSLPGALAGIAGLVLLATSTGIARSGAVVLVFAASTVYLRTALDDDAMPWMLRRYVPVLLPLTLLGVAHLASIPGGRIGRTWRTTGALVLGAWFLAQSWPLLARPGLDAGETSLDALAATTPPGAVLLWDAATPSHAALAAQHRLNLPGIVVRAPEQRSRPLGRLIETQAARGPVRVVLDDADDAQGPRWRRALHGAEFGAVSIVSLSYERPRPARSSLGWTLGRIVRRLAIYPVVPSTTAAPAPLPLRITVGAGDVPYLLGGFHGRERSNGRACRWTAEAGRVRIPRVDAPAGARLRVVLELAAARPAPARAPLHVAWNGQALSTLAPGDGFARHDAGVVTAVDRAGELVLATEPFVPSEHGLGADGRHLGVLVSAIVLERVP
jgi:hypothetical protein